MRLLATTLLLTGSVLFSANAFSQSDDPFGNGQRPDPFGGKATATPVAQARKALQNGRKPVHVATPRQHDVEQQIQAALDSETSFNFVETPLAEAVQVLSTMHDIPIVIDYRALEEIGLTKDQGVNLSLSKTSLRSALRLLLRDLDMTYMIKNEVLQLTTRAAAENSLILEIYQLPDNLRPKAEQVIKIISSTIVPDTWETLGGPSSIHGLDHLVVVSTTSDVHDQIKEFLAKLSEKYGQ
ncbi:hypothetical protein NHH03_10040 [Stieleria sp. TO1_6]|uniref:hypothetical protein n=1 Tax=Stieleria tagensis TaxID=2956795 RepID=UPI00209ADAD4|nr:hypothetical protein [Stieleria tagensis]MCO8122078.1 hypothetical protein [Stieleria tagensis]